MSQNNYTTKRRKFKHLTKEKRAQIEIVDSQSKFHSRNYGGSYFKKEFVVELSLRNRKGAQI